MPFYSEKSIEIDLRKNQRKLSLIGKVMQRLGEIIILSVLTGIGITGCQLETNYKAYEDLNNKGEQVFLKDLQTCHDLTNQNKKHREGSEGAGEFFNRKRTLFRLCMESNYWTVK
jgi:hypothetical protein